MAVVAGGLVLQGCAPDPVPVEPPPPDLGLTPVASVSELMTDIVEPASDQILDAVAVAVSVERTVETVPTTDDDWIRVRRGALTLAEATNLLRMPREIVPPGAGVSTNPGGLPPDEIQEKVDANRPLWNEYVDALGDAALQVLSLVDDRNASQLFAAGRNVDRACESCHLAFWYPEDRDAAPENSENAATTVPAER